MHDRHETKGSKYQSAGRFGKRFLGLTGPFEPRVVVAANAIMFNRTRSAARVQRVVPAGQWVERPLHAFLSEAEKFRQLL